MPGTNSPNHDVRRPLTFSCRAGSPDCADGVRCNSWRGMGRPLCWPSNFGSADADPDDCANRNPDADPDDRANRNPDDGADGNPNDGANRRGDGRASDSYAKPAAHGLG